MKSEKVRVILRREKKKGGRVVREGCGLECYWR